MLALHLEEQNYHHRNHDPQIGNNSNIIAFYNSELLFTSLNTGNAPWDSLEYTSFPFIVTSNEAVTGKSRK